jgi:tetratricopeptide (TPR) repeat protein
VSEKQPPTQLDTDQTVLSKASTDDTSTLLPTRISTAGDSEAKTRQAVHHATHDAAHNTTRYGDTGFPVKPKSSTASAESPTTNTTQYTRYGASGTHSTGFDQAQKIAQHTLDNSGTLLKKRFVLEEILGHGGMGTVYKAKDLRKVEAEDPNPYIATKVLNQDFKDHPDAFVTLQQEAAKSHTLAHPNIVTVHDFDRDGDILFMTMELLQGKPLDELLKNEGKNGFAKPQAMRIVRDLCLALAYAHQRQIIHADFKPGNVFVMHDGSAKVLDFGIARAASKESQKHKFDAGQLGALTPAYATIEMINDEPLTFTDDVYALACVAYEIFSGKHPYAGRSAYTAKQKGLKLKRLDILSGREWRALQRALSLEKNQRTATVTQFLHELFPRRGTLALKIAVAFSLIGIGGAGWFAYQQYQAEVQIKATITDKLMQAQTCFAQSDFLCSIDNARVVLNLEANHAMATNLLQNAQLAFKKQQDAEQIARLFDEANRCIQARDYACAQLKARELLALDTQNSRALALFEQAKNLAQTEEIEALAREVDSCLTQSDLSCAALFTEKATSINSQHPQTLALQNKLAQARTQNQLASAAHEQRMASFIIAGQKCFDQKDYSCAQQQADAALAQDKNYGPAISLRQSASLAAQQAREAESKVKIILAQAKTCLDKQKNYSCAIAKAEAALDIIPNHREASAIKQRAEQTLEQIKQTGFTIR